MTETLTGQAGDTSIKTFAEAEVVLARALPGYESREPQQRLARGVEALFAKREHFVAYSGPEEDYRQWQRPGLVHFLGQAGTGTGKSLGYLIPAILSGKRTVVSVTTKALQSQLADKDLPFLTEHLGVDFEWALLKGRSNYLCLNRVALVNETEVPGLREIIALTKEPEFSGLREEIPFEISHSAWAMICSESEECADNNCSPDSCYATLARSKASKAQIVIANHALFFTDLKLKTYGLGGMLGEYEAVIFDEAHEVEEVAGNTLGGSLSEGAFGSLLSQVRRWGSQFADDDGESLIEPMGRLHQAVAALFSVLEPGRIRVAELNKVAEEISEVYSATEDLRKAIGDSSIEHTPDYRKAQKRKWSLLRGANSIVERLRSVIADPFTDTVRWVEKERTRNGERKVIKIAPILVAPFLHEWLFSKVPSVLVSATLSVKGRFDYITDRLGIHSYQGVDVGTPFDFPRQGRLYVPLNLPEPRGSDQREWQGMAIQEIHRLVTASRGRALVLFTSVAHMKETHRSLSLMSGDLDFKVQGQDSTGNLVEWLRGHDPASPGRVLLATKSFFTGVDIPGDALSLVIVAKMPFPVPTEPLTEARCEAIEAKGGSAFADYTIPVMSLVLQQAAGRLIRHRNDIGCVAILDPRIVTKGYGKQILKDLPPMTRTFDLAEVTAFLA